MPELPEVETVRDGLSRWITGRRISAVHSLHPRAARRHAPGPADLAAQLRDRTVTGVRRRGKYLWIELASPPSGSPAEPPTTAATALTESIAAVDPAAAEALVAHLGMSGQLLVPEPGQQPGAHLRARFEFADGGRELWFVDQRTFGGLHLDELVAVPGGLLPAGLRHIARDPLDPLFDDEAWISAVRRRKSTIKRTLLDQSAISGVGNIYADEALWRARLHGDRPTSSLSRSQLRLLLAEIRAVFAAALAAGGTSFDALYVNVNGQSGYFDRSLNAYGRVGQPCGRCGTPIARQKWMNRSSYFCPRCQRLPRATTARPAPSAARPV